MAPTIALLTTLLLFFLLISLNAGPRYQNRLPFLLYYESSLKIIVAIFHIEGVKNHYPGG